LIVFLQIFEFITAESAYWHHSHSYHSHSYHSRHRHHQSNRCASLARLQFVKNRSFSSFVVECCLKTHVVLRSAPSHTKRVHFAYAPTSACSAAIFVRSFAAALCADCFVSGQTSNNTSETGALCLCAERHSYSVVLIRNNLRLWSSSLFSAFTLNVFRPSLPVNLKGKSHSTDKRIALYWPCNQTYFRCVALPCKFRASTNHSNHWQRIVLCRLSTLTHLKASAVTQTKDEPNRGHRDRKQNADFGVVFRIWTITVTFLLRL
jgi:hypothetical protein